MPKKANPTARRTRNAFRRQQEVISAAARLFQEKGYEATSIQDIADELGILKGSLYYYIDTKEDLLFAIIQEVHETALESLEASRAAEGNALAKIRAFVFNQVRHIASHVERAGVFFQDFRSLSAERKKVIIDERDIYEQFLRSLLERGQRDGVICADLDPKFASLAILGTFNWMYQWYRPTGDRTPDEIAAIFADFLLPTLACDPATHVPGHRSAIGVMGASGIIGTPS
ncbi:MAG: TetR/AcrR family transcriptional regulator [Acidimicrobiales bacterium]